MAFSTRRGRPRVATPKDQTDYGTPELRMKRAFQLTDEPLDLCLSRGIITQAQHRAGLHLRWLYTVRYGAPVVTTQYTGEYSATTPTENDQDWRAAREAEYAEATQCLQNARCYEPVMRLCVFNERPPFLKINSLNNSCAPESMRDWRAPAAEKLDYGLYLLKNLWKFR